MRGWLAVGLVALWALGSTGCMTPGNSESVAQVTVESDTLTAISVALQKVFAAEGFETRHAGLTQFGFEKRGGFANSLAYGGWDKGVWVRASVSVQEKAQGLYLLEASAEVLRNKGDTILEDKMHVSSGYCKKLLKRTKAELEKKAK
jgi:hypothetical protein